MVQIAKLTADLFANTSKFEAGMGRARKTFKNFSKTVATGAKLGAVAVAGITTALGAMGIAQAGVIDETAKLSAALGVNIRQFQALVLVGSEAGITQEQIGTIITKSQRSILEAARGLQTYERSFKTLGLEAKELVKLSPEEQFIKITSALDKVDNSTVRTATALEIFGRSGRQVINMLGDMEGSIAEALEFNDKFGISLNKIDAAKVEEANDTFARVKTALGGLGNVIAIEFAPLVTALSNAFLDSGISAESFGSSVRKAIQVAAVVVDNFRISFLGLKAIFTEIMFALDLFVLDASKSLFDLAGAMAKFPGLQDAATRAQEFALQVNENAQKSARKNQQALKNLGKEAANFTKIEENLAKVQADATKRAEERFSNEQVRGIESVTEALKEQEKATKKVKKEKEEVNELAKDLGLTFSSAFEKAIQDGNKFSDVLQGLLTDIQNILIRRTITEPLGDAVSGIAGSFGGGNFFGDIFGSIFGGFRAAGGPVGAGKAYVVGEKGPELFMPGSSGSIIPNGAGVSGGGGLKVVINNNAGAEVTAQERNTSTGRELTIMVEKVVSDGIGRKGSPINQALAQQQGQSLIRR